MKKFKFVIVGGGTAGMIAASLIKKVYGDYVSVTVVYDHNTPGIGVGESLTPLIYEYLDIVGIKREDLIKHCNATIKLGIKFKNWLNNNKYFYHAFNQTNEHEKGFDFEAGYDLSNNQYDGGVSYSRYFFESNRIPTIGSTHSIHFDASLFGRYIEKRFANELTVIDGIVTSIKKYNNNIEFVELKDGRKIEGDFFIDASGFQYALIRNFENKWIDKTDWMPLNKCIVQQIPTTHKVLNPYTTAEATSQGWIFQIPLQNRWGTGYLYSSRFCSDELAKKEYKDFLLDKYKFVLADDPRILKFNSGYWEKQWIGNCLAIGLASGFTEPLEATNIHHTVFQLLRFVFRFQLKVFKHDINRYNKLINDFYNNLYLYLRFIYNTGRTDSLFWQYTTNNTPQEILDLSEKIKYDLPNGYSLDGHMFVYNNFMQIAYGLEKTNKESYKRSIEIYSRLDDARNYAIDTRIEKLNSFKESLDHLEYIKNIKEYYHG